MFEDESHVVDEFGVFVLAIPFDKPVNLIDATRLELARLPADPAFPLVGPLVEGEWAQVEDVAGNLSSRVIG
jgi:hypothetical protein